MTETWDAESIKALRLGRSRRQTQTEFAQDLLTDRITVSRWERGLVTPSIANMKKLDELAEG